jgi:hypothetical protein
MKGRIQGCYTRGRLFIPAAKGKPRVMGGVSGRRRKHRRNRKKGERECKTEKP